MSRFKYNIENSVIVCQGNKKCKTTSIAHFIAHIYKFNEGIIRKSAADFWVSCAGWAHIHSEFSKIHFVLTIKHEFPNGYKVVVKSFPRRMAHRAAPISVSITLCHRSAESSQGYSGGQSTGSSPCLKNNNKHITQLFFM